MDDLRDYKVTLCLANGEVTFRIWTFGANFESWNLYIVICEQRENLREMNLGPGYNPVRTDASEEAF
jgi:hypothetical protein